MREYAGKRGWEIAVQIKEVGSGAVELREQLRVLYLDKRNNLIADEVLNFRLAYHGACHTTGIAPDLTTFGKIIGGGFPVGAVAGSRSVMSVFDHTGALKVHHGGTFNANPVTIVAGLVWRLAPIGLPPFLYKYGGSVLWAVMVYWLVAFAFPQWWPRRIAIFACLIAALSAGVCFSTGVKNEVRCASSKWGKDVFTRSMVSTSLPG